MLTKRKIADVVLFYTILSNIYYLTRNKWHVGSGK